MKSLHCLVALLVAACAVRNSAHAQFTALKDINVRGLDLVPTEGDHAPNVVKCETGLASYEALKVQAVAARTRLVLSGG